MARCLSDVSSHIFNKSVVSFRNNLCSVNAYGTKGFNEPLADITNRVDEFDAFSYTTCDMVAVKQCLRLCSHLQNHSTS